MYQDIVGDGVVTADRQNLFNLAKDGNKKTILLVFK